MKIVDSFDRCKITKTHVDFLNMYLDGVSNAKLTQFLTDEWFLSTIATKHHFDGFLKNLTYTLNMPYSKKDCIKNKEQILVNLRLAIDYQQRMSEYRAAEEVRLKESGYKPLS